MHIRAILVMLKETQYTEGIFKKYSDVLAPGRYHIYNSFLALILQNPKTRAVADQMFHVKNPGRSREKMSNILNKVRYFKNRNKRSSGEYQALYIANNSDAQREIKLFAFDKKKVLYICKDSETMHKQQAEYQMLKHAYLMPQVTKSDRYATALEVDLVDCKPSPGDSLALTAIAQATAAYNQEPAKLFRRSVKELTAFAYEDERMNELLRILRDRIAPELLSRDLPLCMQHGDLSKENLLYGESKGIEGYWFIDWEHLADRVFFYDYFFHILNSAFYGEPEGLHCYLSGENDETLKSFFSHFGWDFDSDKRVDYFLIFAICFLKERVCAQGNIRILERYCDFIDENCHSAARNGDTV